MYFYDLIYNSHIYHDIEINKALDIMISRNYTKIVGYAHSAGAPILLNYLQKSNREDISLFSGFIFNGPFLDLGHISLAREITTEEAIPAAVTSGLVQPKTKLSNLSHGM